MEPGVSGLLPTDRNPPAGEDIEARSFSTRVIISAVAPPLAPHENPAGGRLATKEGDEHEALETVNTEQRSVVELTLLGYSYPEIAEIVNCPVNTVKTRMFHARQLMKNKLTGVFSDL